MVVIGILNATFKRAITFQHPCVIPSGDLIKYARFIHQYGALHIIEHGHPTLISSATSTTRAENRDWAGSVAVLQKQTILPTIALLSRTALRPIKVLGADYFELVSTDPRAAERQALASLEMK